jgi:uncharacterized protein YrzB (UPF0473 family)
MQSKVIDIYNASGTERIYSKILEMEAATGKIKVTLQPIKI